jgi:ABC-2 type transport system ATP-binding protein
MSQISDDPRPTSEDNATALAVEATDLVKQYRGRGGTVDAVRQRIGVALQEAGLDPRQTGRELLILQARLFGLSHPEAAGRAEELLDLVELVDAADRRIKGYSGGMKRRLDLASALVHQPAVLFLDEPTTGLDPASRLTVWDEVRRINERGTTVFLTTQYLEEADQLCDRLAIIDEGLIVREGTPVQLKADLRERRGLDADPSLDEVFLDATGRTRERVAGEVQEVAG